MAEQEDGCLRYTQNRELSWLRFNDRVLSEATDETVPLLERLKFIAIFTSNLDEFFMIRVGSLTALAALGDVSVDKKSGMTPAEQLQSIYKAVRPLYLKREAVFREVESQLRLHGVYQLNFNELRPAEKKFVRNYFRDAIEPILSPQIIDTHHPFPHLQNKVLHVGASLRAKNTQVFAVIPMPSVLPDVLFLPGSDVRCIGMEQIVTAYLGKIFRGYKVTERLAFCVTRNADINPNDEAFDFGEDFRAKMLSVLGKRRRLAPVRLELNGAISDRFSRFLCEKLGLSREQVYQTAAPLKLEYVYDLADRLTEMRRKALLYPEFRPCWPSEVRRKEGLIRQIQRRDLMLSYPFESMEVFVRLLKEAAYDPAVISIKITIYRLARNAKLVDYLCAAAENGKVVTVLIELRARFDEKNNIDWSERLENAGCTVIYGFEDYKVHSKICLITRREKGAIQFITQVGTGNYNEKTAAMYTDLSLLTADPRIGADANAFFRNMAIGNLNGQYTYLLVAPCALKSRVMACIDREMAKGHAGRICIKINSITDLEIIEKLKQASCAGVQIHMIVRGICCILPGVPGKTENIHIVSIVGRFLEHSRVYCFGEGESEQMYIASADFMTRNTQRRIEVACPVFSEGARKKLRHILDCCLRDVSKARMLDSSGVYHRREGEAPFSSQEQLMLDAQQGAVHEQADAVHGFGTFWEILRRLFHGFRSRKQRAGAEGRTP